jgi:hypothetical protein
MMNLLEMDLQKAKIGITTNAVLGHHACHYFMFISEDGVKKGHSFSHL